MNILIGSLIRDREWILPSFLQGLYDLDYPKHKISLFFIINDSKDKSGDIIDDFCALHHKEYKSIEFRYMTFNSPENKRQRSNRLILYSILSELRNEMVEYLLRSDNDYLFNIDCDILVKPNSLNELLKYTTKDQYSMAAAMIFNDFNKGKIGNAMEKIHNKNRFKHIYLSNELVLADLSGACMITKRELLENSDYRYEFHPQGEDAGFHFKTAINHYKIPVIPNLASHFMKKVDL